MIDETLLTGAFSVLAAMLAAYATTRTAIRVDRAKHHSEILQAQRYKYFLPFKYAADEFLRRLRHIEMRLAVNDALDEKFREMCARLAVDVRSQSPEWFYSDSASPVGGYFLASTMYMNCVLFYWMGRIQAEYPYIPLKMALLRRERHDSYLPPFKGQAKPPKIKGRCTVYDFIKEVKVRFSGAGGISYGVHDSIGNSLYSKEKNRILNYDEFVSVLGVGKTRAFLPVVRFWTSLVAGDGTVDRDKLSRIRDLVVVLQLLQHVNMPKG